MKKIKLCKLWVGGYSFVELDVTQLNMALKFGPYKRYGKKILILVDEYDAF